MTCKSLITTFFKNLLWLTYFVKSIRDLKDNTPIKFISQIDQWSTNWWNLITRAEIYIALLKCISPQGVSWFCQAFLIKLQPINQFARLNYAIDSKQKINYITPTSSNPNRIILISHSLGGTENWWAPKEKKWRHNYI